MSTVAIPHRQFTKHLTAIGRAAIGADIEPLVADICRRVHMIRRTTQAGMHLFADAEGNVYVLRDQSPCAARIVSRQRAIHVGLYGGDDVGRGHQIEVDADRVRNDLVSHFFRVGFLTPAMIYGQVNREP